MSKHYRESLNFTIERLEKISRKLDAFRGTVNSIRNAATPTTPSKEAGILARGIITKFEMYMNHDLDVNTAFEAIFRIVSRLSRLAQNGRLSPKDSSLAIAYLRRIDEVLQVIF
jgi:cysteinyl-tRNA synthetase